MAELLSDDQVAQALAKLESWQQNGAALTRSAELASFPQAIAVVNRIAEIAENNNHHPDMQISWRTVVFRCSTHSAGGITALDVSLAEEIDGVLEVFAQTSE
ncbi:4a-hydroxytetrahydrobiopterin dehydratase [Kutzneria viridogrisea]|uniref:Putative pterin-4-alpha-carbinolamine dehydratase n=1 Tax=Kutzneria viridogrisea TaxID=47990 RepID=A0ABR6BTQ1_9PSEU|nr:4a-hydroxytetrahydrobiopterin dehydratase [Kutzneria viridogrisea]